jgi:rod shape-determining protein MreC
MRLLKKNNLAIFSLVVLVAMICMFLGRNAKNKPLETSVRSATSPIARFFSGIGVWADDKFSFVTNISNLKKENKELFEENLIIKARNARLADVEKENEELRKQIDLAPREKYSLISALVVGKDLKEQNETIHLDKGKKDGVKEHAAVIVGEGVFVGRVSEVFETSCNVELLINANSKINAEVVGPGARGIARGQFGNSIVLDMIPQALKVEREDAVITSGVGGLLPRGLLIGYTQDMTPTADQLFQKTSLILPFQIDKLRVVWIIEGEK